MHTVHAGEVIALEEIPLTLFLDCVRHQNDFFLYVCHRPSYVADLA
jgi:hypothetical protein